MMFSQEQMEEWEARAVPLDERGESEAYFPLWGIVDVDDYLQKSDASRAERQHWRTPVLKLRPGRRTHARKVQWALRRVLRPRQQVLRRRCDPRRARVLRGACGSG